MDIGSRRTVYLRITRESAELVEPEEVTSFRAECPADLGRDELADRARQAGFGELLDDGHLMVPIETIRRLAAGLVGPGWLEDFAGMIAYATGKGWVSGDGTHVRAHLERTG
jgi:hypothetical protein